jgi:hypothetical protein
VSVTEPSHGLITIAVLFLVVLCSPLCLLPHWQNFDPGWSAGVWLSGAANQPICEFLANAQL